MQVRWKSQIAMNLIVPMPKQLQNVIMHQLRYITYDKRLCTSFMRALPQRRGDFFKLISVVNKDLTLKAKAKDLTSRTTSTGFLHHSLT